MKRIAIITPCILPVPATAGGAVEGLITKLINDNEKYHHFIIDLFAINDHMSKNQFFEFTNCIDIHIRGAIKTADKVVDKLIRLTAADSSFRILDQLICKAFSIRLKEIDGVYDAVIIENMMSTACEIIKICEGIYDFPVYFHMHNDIDVYRSPRHIHELVKHGVQFLAVSNYINCQILKSDKNAVVYTLNNAIDLSAFTNSKKKSGEDISVLYSGRIIPEKGVKELVLAFVQMIDQVDLTSGKNVELSIVGFSGFNRSYENEIRAIAEKYDCIHCIRQQSADEMPKVYDKADILVVPTVVEEPFGLVALEGMAMGIALIVTKSGALPEIVGDAACVVSKEGDVIANLSGAITRLIIDESYREELQKKAIKQVQSKDYYNIDNYYQNFVQLIDRQMITDKDMISVIVPVYNVLPFLRECVDSIIDQTYHNLDIILIDDGSSDGTSDICDEYAETDSRIRVIHQENKGLSAARNIGIEEAEGEYIYFCDGDDFLQNYALEKLIHKLKKDHADIVACGFIEVFDDDKDSLSNAHIFTDSKCGLWSGHESVIRMMRDNSICSVVWNKLYKRCIFNNIRFPENTLNEDEAVTYKTLYKARLVSYIPEVLYMYRQRKSSIMHQDLQDRYRFLIKAGIDRIDFFKDNGDEELEQHSRITLLEWIKFFYRKIDNVDIKKELLGIYKGSLILDNAPIVMGRKKQLALILWKYLHY